MLIVKAARKQQAPIGARALAPWVSFDDRSSGLLSSYVNSGSLQRTAGAFGSGYQGNGSSAGTYCTASVTAGALSSTDSTTIACVFSTRATTGGVLVSLGRSANATGGYLLIEYSASVLNLAVDDGSAGSQQLATAANSYADGRPHSLVGQFRTNGTTRYLRLWLDGVQIASSSSTAAFDSTTYDRFAVGMLRRSASAGYVANGTRIYDAWYAKGLTEDDARAASADIWTTVYGPQRIWVPVSAVGEDLLIGQACL